MEAVLVALEGRDLGEELVIYALHLLSHPGPIFSILLRLLPLAVERGLLLRHLLLHVSEHLKELGFIS